MQDGEFNRQRKIGMENKNYRGIKFILNVGCLRRCLLDFSKIDFEFSDDSLLFHLIYFRTYEKGQQTAIFVSY